MKKKLDQTIKGHIVADGREQQDKIEPKYATSPTLSTEAVMLATKIGALKGRDVAMVDITGAYLSAGMDDKMHVVFRGTLAELVVAANPVLYIPFVPYTTG